MGKLRNELLNKEIFDKLKDVNVVIERWQKENKQQRPYSSLRYRTSNPEVFIEWR